MMTWDYADLSSMAKASGGPEGLLRDYYNYGRAYQHSEDLLLSGIACTLVIIGKAAAKMLTMNANQSENPRRDNHTIELKFTTEQEEKIKEYARKGEEHIKRYGEGLIQMEADDEQRN